MTNLVITVGVLVLVAIALGPQYRRRQVRRRTVSQATWWWGCSFPRRAVPLPHLHAVGRHRGAAEVPPVAPKIDTIASRTAPGAEFRIRIQDGEDIAWPATRSVT